MSKQINFRCFILAKGLTRGFFDKEQRYISTDRKYSIVSIHGRSDANHIFYPLFDANSTNFFDNARKSNEFTKTSSTGNFV